MARPRFPAHAPRPPGAPLPLEGLRVVDFTQMLAGPFATQGLGDLGAEVIKIEAPGRGDDSRHYSTTALAGECAFYLSTNRNKKSVTLDLKSEAGADIARRLIDRADILVENFSNGVMERLGLDYDAVSKTNPGLIYCSVSAYGRDDASAVARRGYDAMFQAASGFMSITGEKGRMPMRTTVPIIDTATAISAQSAILAAVIARQRFGVGQHLEVALLDVAIWCLSMYGMAHLVSGEEIERNGNRAPQTAPSDVYDTLTGPIFLTCGNDRLFERLCRDGLERPDLLERPEFRSNPDRVRNISALTDILSEVFRGRPREEWIERLSSAGVPASPVLSIPQAMVSADVARRAIVSEIRHPTAGSMPNVRAPFQFSATPCADPVAPPLLGEHTDAVMRDVLGLSEDEVRSLRRAGAFG